jgi:hypothetical protein
MEQAETAKRKSTLNISIILCWILGILNLGGGISIGIAMLRTGRPILFPIIIFIIGIGLCAAGYGLKKRRKYAGILSIIFALSAFISPPVIGLLLGVLIIVFTAINWKELN